jgi:hypothetical protein
LFALAQRDFVFAKQGRATNARQKATIRGAEESKGKVASELG